MKPSLSKYLQQMKDTLETRQAQRLHHLQASSVHGVISMAKFDSFVNLTEFYSSITVDNEGYLYLWVSLPTRS